MHKIRDIIFDFDGTLVDSAPGILAAFGAVLRERDIAPLLPLTPALIGAPLAETLARLAGWSEPDRLTPLIDEFKRSYDTEGVRATPPYAGVEPMLQKLIIRRIRLHIATNKRLSATRLILDHLGWTEYFASVYALDMREPRVPDKGTLIGEQMLREEMNRGATCYVGDRIEDGEAAERQPIPFVFAGWGYGGEGILSHWRRADRPDALLGLLEAG